MTIEFPLRLISSANAREHWYIKKERVKTERKAVWAELHRKRWPKMQPPFMVTITRLGPRIMDGDNNQIAAKGVRDEIAAFLGIDDGSDQITWNYKQEKSKEYRVRIEINATN